MYKVFFNNNSLFLANQLLQKQTFSVSYKYTNLKNLKEFIFTNCSEIENKEILIYHTSLSNLWNNFKSLFEVKNAGGGLVINANNEILFIKRRGLWDLPKGHQEKNEDIETTAIREVMEECGISNLKIIKPLINTYHTYWLNAKAILKPSHWYLMQYTNNEQGSPQTEEDITEIKWFAKNELEDVYLNTFPSIRDVVTDYYEDRDV